MNNAIKRNKECKKENKSLKGLQHFLFPPSALGWEEKRETERKNGPKKENKHPENWYHDVCYY